MKNIILILGILALGACHSSKPQVPIKPPIEIVSDPGKIRAALRDWCLANPEEASQNVNCECVVSDRPVCPLVDYPIYTK